MAHQMARKQLSRACLLGHEGGWLSPLVPTHPSWPQHLRRLRIRVRRQVRLHRGEPERVRAADRQAQLGEAAAGQLLRGRDRARARLGGAAWLGAGGAAQPACVGAGELAWVAPHTVREGVLRGGSQLLTS